MLKDNAAAETEGGGRMGWHSKICGALLSGRRWMEDRDPPLSDSISSDCIF